MSTKLNNRFTRSPKKIGPKQKLESKDKFLLTLMKLRLGLLVKDLASRFKICAALTSDISRLDSSYGRGPQTLCLCS